MKFDSNEYMSALLASARDSGTVHTGEITELAINGGLTAEQIEVFLDELRESRADVVPEEKFIPGKQQLRALLREIRECPLEKEAFAGRTKSEDPIKLYFDDLAQTGGGDPRLETDLMYEAADGNDEATGRLIELCMYIPVIAAYKLIGKNALFSDLVQEGNMELMAAADEFDFAGGRSFSAYAALRIGKQLAMLTADEPETVKLPTGLAEDIVKILRRKSLMKGGRNEITAAAIAAAEGISEERVNKALDALRAAGGEDIGSGPEENETVLQKSNAEQQLSAQVSQLLAALPEEQAKVLTLRYGIGGKALSEEETAERLGKSTEEIKKLEELAISRLGS